MKMRFFCQKMEWFAISSASDETTLVWSVATLTVHHSVKANAALSSCLVGENCLIASQSARAAVHVYQLGSAESPLKCPMPEKMHLAVSPCGSFLFGGGASGKLHVWATGSGVLLRVVEAHYREVTCLAVTGDGACVITGGDDGVVHAWLVSTLVDTAAPRKPQAQHTWTAHGLRITGLHCAIGGFGETVVLSSSLDCTVKMWRVSTGALVADVVFPRAICAVAMDSMEQYVFAGASDGTIYCVNFRQTPVEKHMAVSGRDESAQSVQFRSVLSGHTFEITALRSASVGARQLLLSGARDGLVNVWDIESGELISTFKKHSGSSVSTINLGLYPSGCVFPEQQRVAVGKLQKFQQDAASANGLLWRCIGPANAIASVAKSVAGGSNGNEKGEASVSNAVGMSGGDGLEQRLEQLERENEELRQANKRLYEFNIEKVLQRKQKKLKQKSKQKKRAAGE